MIIYTSKILYEYSITGYIGKFAFLCFMPGKPGTNEYNTHIFVHKTTI